MDSIRALIVSYDLVAAFQSRERWTRQTSFYGTLIWDVLACVVQMCRLAADPLSPDQMSGRSHDMAPT